MEVTIMTRDEARGFVRALWMDDSRVVAWFQAATKDLWFIQDIDFYYNEDHYVEKRKKFADFLRELADAIEVG
jgi:hypothetical protein